MPISDSIPGPDQFKAALDDHPLEEIPALPGRTNHIEAGVLIPIIWDPTPRVLVTRRSDSLHEHGGEICFPGGRPEPGDADICATAIREAREELGIEDIALLGRLSSMPIYTSDYRIEPFVAQLLSGTLTPNPDEVSRILYIDLAEVVQRKTQPAQPFIWNGEQVLSPVFQVQGEKMYGATAHSFWELVKLMAPLFGTVGPDLVPLSGSGPIPYL